MAGLILVVGLVFAFFSGALLGAVALYWWGEYTDDLKQQHWMVNRHNVTEHNGRYVCVGCGEEQGSPEAFEERGNCRELATEY
jgi:membrane protein YqaA with SNARE-associated domain